MRTAALFLTCLLVLSAQAADAVVPPPDGHTVHTLKGFTLLVHETVLQQPADRWGRKPLDVLELEFEDLKRVLNPKLHELLRKIPVYVSWDSNEVAHGAVAVYRSGSPAPDARDEQSLKLNCIEILTLKRLGEIRPPGSPFQQIVTLHEMAHAIHHRLLGFEAPEVKAAFRQAVERRLYDDVWDRTHRRAKAYARTNANEYFAEISCAYLDSCFFYPFTYSDLKSHDPVGFALVESVWKRPDQFAGRKLETIRTPQFVVEKSGGGQTGPAAEREAFAQVDRARALIRSGKKDDAKRLLQSVLQKFPATLAADDARRLLTQAN